LVHRYHEHHAPVERFAGGQASVDDVAGLHPAGPHGLGDLGQVIKQGLVDGGHRQDRRTPQRLLAIGDLAGQGEDAHDASMFVVANPCKMSARTSAGKPSRSSKRR